MYYAMRMMLLGILVAFFYHGRSQHCPFDGSYVVVVKLLLPPGADTPTLWLRQPEPVSDSCAYGYRLVSTPLRSNAYWRQEAEADIHGQHYRWLFPRLQEDYDFLSGHLAAFLTAASRYCMVPDGPNFRYTPRPFEVSCSFQGRQHVWTVNPGAVYHLCSTAGSWQRVMPMTIDLRQ